MISDSDPNVRKATSAPSQLNQAIAEEFSGVETTLCLSTKVIVITEDQLELRIEDGIKKLSAGDGWIAPLGILVSCLGALFTADFKNFPWAAAGTLRGVFIATAAGSTYWLVRSLFSIKRFGRQELMSSIRKAGSSYNLSQGVSGSGMALSSREDTRPQKPPDSDAVRQPLQCRQCGSILPDSALGQMSRCPTCGTVN